MLRNFGPLEISLIMLIILILFGRGKIGQFFGELGSGINAFKQGLKDDEAEATEELQPETTEVA